MAALNTEIILFNVKEHNLHSDLKRRWESVLLFSSFKCPVKVSYGTEFC